jgi:hypothetical protein
MLAVGALGGCGAGNLNKSLLQPTRPVHHSVNVGEATVAGGIVDPLYSHGNERTFFLELVWVELELSFAE